MKLSIIIPFGTSRQRKFIGERVRAKSEELKGIPDVEVVFVEGFSSLPDDSLREKIIADGHSYYKDAEQSRFSQGQCRNWGVILASAPVCLFLDVDYYISRQMLAKVMLLADVKEIADNPNQFLILPCAFLSETGSMALGSCPRDKWDIIVQHDYISGQNKLIHFLAPASSAMVVNRHKFLEFGGNDDCYIGHSYEDFDLIMRFLRECGSFDLLPAELKYDSRSWNFREYKGFRALMAVPGFEALLYGICLYHFYHPEPNNDGYLDNREYNHQKFYHKLEAVKNVGDFPSPLLDKTKLNRNVLLFTVLNGSCCRSLRGVRPYLGKLQCTSEANFFDGEQFEAAEFEDYLKTQHIDLVIFPNPYGNERRRKIYEYMRENGLAYICYDRGALPDSWFFDPHGFNYDSYSYCATLWNKELSQEKRYEVIEYIAGIKASDTSLEIQGEREDPDILRTGIGGDKARIIFIPLQVEDDTVIKYFTEEPFSYYGFLSIVNNVAKNLSKDGYIFIAKKHPLTKNLAKERYPYLSFVKDDTNIHTLLELCDAVLTINSGVGVHAMIYEKPCLVCGNAFYQFDGINVRIHNERELQKRLLKWDFQFDKEAMLGFIYHLKNNVYSFGKSHYTVTEKNNRFIRSVNYIDFYRINIDGEIFLNAKSIAKYHYKQDSLPLRQFVIGGDAVSGSVGKAGTSSCASSENKKKILIICDLDILSSPCAQLSRINSIGSALASVYTVDLLCIGKATNLSPQQHNHIYHFNRIAVCQTQKVIHNKSFDDVFTTFHTPRKWRNPEYASSLVAFLNGSSKYDAIVFEGKNIAWLVDTLPYSPMKILDTFRFHDNIANNIVNVSQSITSEEKFKIFSKFDAVLVALDEDIHYLGSNINKLRVLHTPYYRNITHNFNANRKNVNLGYVASMEDKDNLSSVQWFIKNVWSLNPDASPQLHIFGKVCSQLNIVQNGIVTHGMVDSPDDIYELCDIMINPLQQYKGLRIKTVEALAYGKPVLASPAGAAGVPDPEASGVYVARSRGDFLAGLLRLQSDPILRQRQSSRACDAAKLLFARQNAVGPLLALIGSKINVGS